MHTVQKVLDGYLKVIVQNDAISVNLQIIAQIEQLSHMFRDTGMDSHANTVGKTIWRDWTVFVKLSASFK